MRGRPLLDGIPPKLTLEYLYVELALSLPEIADRWEWPRSRVRQWLLLYGIPLRPRSDAVRAARHKLGSGFRGKHREFSEAHKANIRLAAISRGILTAAGVSITSQGYLRYTRGEHKGRLVHVVLTEQEIGRRLAPNECVHHRDGDKLNNRQENRRLMLKRSHNRLHGIEAAPYRSRRLNGTFC